VFLCRIYPIYPRQFFQSISSGCLQLLLALFLLRSHARTIEASTPFLFKSYWVQFAAILHFATLFQASSTSAPRSLVTNLLKRLDLPLWVEYRQQQFSAQTISKWEIFQVLTDFTSSFQINLALLAWSQIGRARIDSNDVAEFSTRYPFRRICKVTKPSFFSNGICFRKSMK